MIYFDILTKICGRLGDPNMDTYKERAKSHFLRAISHYLMSGDYIMEDIPGYHKLKTTLNFTTNPYDTSPLNILKTENFYLDIDYIFENDWFLLKDFGAGFTYVPSMVVNSNVLYVGVEKIGYSKVWSYDGSTWTNLNFPEITGFIYALEFYEGDLYVSIKRWVYKYSNSSWSLVNTYSSNFIAQRMKVYEGNLYICVNHGTVGNAFIDKFNGTSWTDVYTMHAQSFGGKSMYVSNSNLYVGDYRKTSVGFGARILKFDDSSWTEEYDFGTDYDSVESIISYNNYLYAGLGIGAGNGDVFTNSSGSWALSKDFGGEFEGVFSMEVIANRLYVGLGSGSDDADVWKYNGAFWVEDFDFGAVYERVYSLIDYNNRLYAGIGKNTGGGSEGDIYSKSFY